MHFHTQSQDHSRNLPFSLGFCVVKMLPLIFQYAVFLLQEQVEGKRMTLIFLIKKLVCLIQSLQMLSCLRSGTKPYWCAMKQCVDRINTIIEILSVWSCCQSVIFIVLCVYALRAWNVYSLGINFGFRLMHILGKRL